MKNIDCRSIQNQFKKLYSEQIKSFKFKLKLVIIKIGNDYASNKYVNQKVQHCEDVGIAVELITLPKDIQESDLISLIEFHNQCEITYGIIVQLPFPRHINEFNVLSAINPIKDVDCLSPYNIGLLHSQKPYTKPCTALGIIDLLKLEGEQLQGKKALIIGRSNIVGRPLAELFVQEDMTVTLAHSKSNVPELLEQDFDIIVSAIGQAKYFKNLKAKVLIDVGINFDENNKMCGDIDLDTCEYDWATPVPNGVGRLTICGLIQNMITIGLKNNV